MNEKDLFWLLVKLPVCGLVIVLGLICLLLMVHARPLGRLSVIGMEQFDKELGEKYPNWGR